MSSKRLHYSDEKWLDLISECWSSGLSDKDWCMEHQIGISTFYYHVKRLRNKACSIPPATVGAVIPCQKQEVVELNFNPGPGLTRWIHPEEANWRKRLSMP